MKSGFVPFVVSMAALSTSLVMAEDPYTLKANLNPTLAAKDDEELLEQGKDCLTEGRLDNIFAFFSTYTKTQRGPVLPYKDKEDALKSIVLSPDTYELAYNGSGIFKGLEDAIEYLSLADASLNNEAIATEGLNVTSVECLSADKAVVETYSLVNIVATGFVTEREMWEFHFAPDSSLLVATLTEVPRSIKSLIIESPYDRRTLCEAVLSKCTGDLFPYESLQECYDLTATIPDICEGPQSSNYTNGVLQGDTMACRYLHLLSAGLRPRIHCQHMANISDKCQPKHCPITPRLAEPVVVNEVFDAGHAPWIRWTELALVGVFTILGLIAIVWHRRIRAWAFVDACPETKRLSEVLSSLSLAPHGNFPVVAFEDLALSWRTTDTDSSDRLVVSCKQGFLGGCSLTAVTGDSGSGKTTFIRLLCGFQESHMELTCGLWTRRDPVAYCPQFGDMWPLEMPVRDILLFACTVGGTRPSQFGACFNLLGLMEVLDQPFDTLSGGQKQRVNLAATIVRPEPTLILLDEPLASLDESNAIACLDMLKHLPTRHSFVMSVHQPTADVERCFDRHVHFDAKQDKLIKEVRSDIQDDPLDRTPGTADEFETRGVPSNSSPASTNRATVSASLYRSMQGSLILWLGQFGGAPILELLILFSTVCGGLLVGFLGRGSVADWDEQYLPTNEAGRIPFYMADLLVGMAFIMSFGVSLVYANRETRLARHFITMRLLSPGVYLSTNLVFRSVFHGCFQACGWTFVGLGAMGLVQVDSVDMFFVNAAVFGAAWGGATFATALMSPIMYSGHSVLVLDVLMVFFSGAFFFWSQLYDFFKVLHYFNPLFYILSANAHLILNGFDTGCDANAHPMECASGSRVLEITEIQPFRSLTAQAFNVGFLALFSFLVWWYLQPGKVSDSKVKDVSLAPSSMRRSSKRSLSMHVTTMTSRRLNTALIDSSRIDWTDLSTAMHEEWSL